MIISKKCPNCSEVSTQDASATACPICGVIYRKIEAATTSPEAPAPTTPSLTTEIRHMAARPKPRQKAPFIDTLRAESNYPNFRLLIRLATWFFYLLAFVILIQAIFADGGLGIARIGAITGSLIMVVVATATKEASFMLADLSDATVRMAKRQERGT